MCRSPDIVLGQHESLQAYAHVFKALTYKDLLLTPCSLGNVCFYLLIRPGQLQLANKNQKGRGKKKRQESLKSTVVVYCDFGNVFE